jgi:hypothetical protein
MTPEEDEPENKVLVVAWVDSVGVRERLEAVEWSVTE